MKIPWKMAKCGYPGCKFWVFKRNEAHCWKHHQEILERLRKRMVNW